MSIVKTLFPPGGLAAGGCHATIVLADGTKIYVERDYSLTICPDGRKVTTDSSDFQNPINRIVDRCWDKGVAMTMKQWADRQKVIDKLTEEGSDG